jgi:hypothetical protein
VVTYLAIYHAGVVRAPPGAATPDEPLMGAPVGSCLILGSLLGREDVRGRDSQHVVLRIDGLAGTGDVADIIG